MAMYGIFGGVVDLNQSHSVANRVGTLFCLSFIKFKQNAAAKTIVF